MKLDRAPIDRATPSHPARRAGLRELLPELPQRRAHALQRLTELGLTEQQIRDNLMFATDKIGDTMTVAMRRKDAKEWFGVAPPDLSVIARSRGADWLYTYLRTFYRDDSRDTGWNNLVFPNVGMPHVLYELQGAAGAEGRRAARASTAAEPVRTLVLQTAGQASPAASTTS